MGAATIDKNTAAVWKACCDIIGNEGAPVDSHANLMDIGLDSLGLAELVIQLEEIYGEGAITIDDILGSPIVSEIAARLAGTGGAATKVQPAVVAREAAAAPKPAAVAREAAAAPKPVASGAPCAIYLFAGEGAHSAGLDVSILKTSPSFAAVDKALIAQHGVDTTTFLDQHLGDHSPPYSPVVTTVVNILQADLWKLWGHAPAFALGHSVGEIGAAYVSNLLDVPTALRIAYENGAVASALSGRMVHTLLPAQQLDQLPKNELHLAAVNHLVGSPTADNKNASQTVSVTLCGTPQAVTSWLAMDEGAVELRPTCPWHHVAYATTDAIREWGKSKTASMPSLGECESVQPEGDSCVFLSSVTGRVSTAINKAHWRAWLTQPVVFKPALDELATLVSTKPSYLVQIGPHPVLDAAVASLASLLDAKGSPLLATVSSMRRGAPPAAYLREQRALLSSSNLLSSPLVAAIEAAGALTIQVGGESRTLRIDLTLAEQGVTSAQIPLLARRLAPYFPGLAPHDLYRFTSVSALLSGWDAADEAKSAGASTSSAETKMNVLGWGATLPANVSNDNELWKALLDGKCAISSPPDAFKEHCQLHAGYLHPQFDSKRAAAVAKAAGVDSAEANVIDPQHALALDLVKRCFENAGEAAQKLATADRERIGVYIGAWQQPADDAGRKSAYSAIGSSLSALAARVANCFDLHGPALTINTACSSSLVAIDTAMRDMRTGRIDYALVGGVNLIATSPKAADAFAHLKRATMLSPTFRCHTLSAAADGYVRAEGGVVFLLQSTDVSDQNPAALPARAVVVGSAVNQNTQRKPMTAVDPVAQERVVRSACRDAGIVPSTLSAVEMHGTGTKLGDPVELSALSRVTAKDGSPSEKDAGCTLTAAKMHFGHLESAAGALGLLKACLMLNKRVVPHYKPDEPGLNPAVEPIIRESRLKLPDEGGTPLPDGAYVGISSFGFSGNNAHVVLQMAGAQKPAVPVKVPVNATPAVQAQAAMPPQRASKQAAHVVAPVAATAAKAALAEVAPKSLPKAQPVSQITSSPATPNATIATPRKAPGAQSMPRMAPVTSKLPVTHTFEVVHTRVVVRKEPSTTAPTGRVCRKGDIVTADAVEHGWAHLQDGSGWMLIDGSGLGLGELLREIPKPPVMAKPPVTPKAPVAAKLTTSTKASPVLQRIGQLESVVLELAGALKALTPISQHKGEALSSPPQSKMQLPDVAPVPSAVDNECSDCATTPVATDAPSDWIQTTHVGSLPRATGDLAPGAIVSAQRACGLSVINDGEWSRENYIGDMLSRIGGVGSDGHAQDSLGSGCMCDMPIAADMKAVPTYAQRFTGGNGLITLNPKRVAKADVACTDTPRYLGGASLMNTITPFVNSLTEAGVPLSSAFWTVPSPGTLALFCEDRFFKGDQGAFVRALAEAMRPEFEAIAATGLTLQIDCPDLAMGRHTRYHDLTDKEFSTVAEANVAALNYALEAIPASRVRIHVCWGNYAGPHHLDLDAYSVWPHVAKVKCKYVLIEGANPRHNHEIARFEEAVKTGLIDTTKLVICPGVIDTTAARVEHPELVAERLLRFVSVAGHPSRVIASTDCGFASTARSVAITADLAWRKLEALVEGAALATRLYMQAQAPVPMKAPALTPTPFRIALLLCGPASAPSAKSLVDSLTGLSMSTNVITSSSIDVLQCAASSDGAKSAAHAAFEALRWAVDFPLALVAFGVNPDQTAIATAAAQRAQRLLKADSAASRRPSTVFVCGGANPHAGQGVVYAGNGHDPAAVAALVSSTMLANTSFDRRTLALGANSEALPAEAEVVVIGGGLLGMVAAQRLIKNGRKVVILEQRSLVGGIWSMHANSTSQVNSSEGGYCLKEFLAEDSPRKHQHNRDHSTAAEVLKDLAEFGASLKEHIHLQTQVVQVLGTDGDYHVVVTQHGGAGGGVTKVIKCSGVVLAINDRVGMPRSLSVPGMDSFKEGGGVMADGTSDLLKTCDWRGKRVVVFGMGAFAVENVRTALESGAEHVTVVARRLGTVCPKMIDYLNFVKPWDDQYRHETSTNVKQLKCWRETYRQSGAAPPETWPGKIKHDGHTISVSDIWFVAHHLGKMTTKIGTLAEMCAEGCVLADGTVLPCDIVVGCIGFERNTTFCEQLTGRSVVKHSNYLDKNMIYLADAEIDETAFNSFFGSSVLEYAKFYTNVYAEAFERPDALGPMLWAPSVASCPVKLRKWTQYIAVASELIANDPACCAHAATQVSERTKHFYRTMPPRTFVEVNRKEWEELHHRLNGGVTVPKAKQLPYLFGAAAEWCAPPEQVITRRASRELL